MSRAGDLVAQFIAEGGNASKLRWLASRLNDKNERAILLEALFEGMDVVDKLAFVAEFGLPESLKGEAGERLLREGGAAERP